MSSEADAPLTVDQLTHDELDVVVDWAAEEGWNPGIGDAQIFWDTDPDAFVGVHDDGELTAAGAIVSYGGEFGFDRAAFLRPWIEPDGGLGLGLLQDGELHALGVVRPCREGFKVWPLFASDAPSAERVLSGLGAVFAGEPVFLDVPENNNHALTLATRFGMEEVFGCARMYLRPAPPLPWDRIYGVTTFELG